MTLWISALVLATAVGVGLRLWLRAWHRRRIARRRTVEKPNSYYSGPGVRRMVDLHRWGRIELGRLHPVNRDEAERLLGLAWGGGFDALAPDERRFLDNMARLAQAPPKAGDSVDAPQPREGDGSGQLLVPHYPT